MTSSDNKKSDTLQITKKTPKPPIDENTIVYNDSNEVVFRLNEKIGIRKNTDSLVLPNSKQIQDSLYHYLNNHINEELILVSWFSENEANKNIGKERGNKLKALFVNGGMNPDRITVLDSLGEFKFSNDASFSDAFSFHFKKLSNERLAIVNKGIEHKTLYTRFNSRNFKPDNTMNAYLEELKSYLQQFPNKKVTIVGHTDDVGDDKVNIVIARDRATNVMKYFARNGINKEAMTVVSKGESEPVADNTSDEGRSKNRRIEIIIN